MRKKTVLVAYYKVPVPFYGLEDYCVLHFSPLAEVTIAYWQDMAQIQQRREHLAAIVEDAMV